MPSPRLPSRKEPGQHHLPTHTLDVSDVTPLQLACGWAPPSLLVDLALESLDLTPQVLDDTGVLGDVIGNIK